MPRRQDIEHILIIGSGPIIIGQACEFDYSGAQACKALREEGYRVSLVNSNPATIMTDPEFADATYVEPLTVESAAKIIEKEKKLIAQKNLLSKEEFEKNLINLRKDISKFHKDRNKDFNDITKLFKKLQKSSQELINADKKNEKNFISLEKKYLKIQKEMVSAMKAVHFNSTTIEALMEALYELNI